MSFGDLKARAGQQALNNFLATRSYIEGYAPSQADVAAFDGLGAAPPADLFHALRFYNHVKSYSDAERKSFPGAAAAPAAAKKVVDEDDVDLFGSDEEEEDAEAIRIREERLKLYAAKKGNKPSVIAKSLVKLDVKPWDDETDMAAMEANVRSIQMDGLVWGIFSLAPVAYGVKKLVVQCVIEDDKVSTNDLEDKITAFEDLVQSVDIVVFSKL
jgi:elongation factor 1-beta